MRPRSRHPAQSGALREVIGEISNDLSSIAAASAALNGLV